ncbi:MAG: hypothetical protein OIF57_16660 [Marinobacterium sp.]|nr:hypothetical protein [Marinobacterium sp.]
MRIFWLSVLLMCCSSVQAGRYLKPAYITNAYFTNNIVDVGGFTQPDSVFNVLAANEAQASAMLVMNLLLDKGTHRIEIDILDADGNKIDELRFEPLEAAEDNWTYTLTGQFGGSYTPGGLFFKAYDRYNNNRRKRFHLGTLRLLTE